MKKRAEKKNKIDSRGENKYEERKGEKKLRKGNEIKIMREVNAF